MEVWSGCLATKGMIHGRRSRIVNRSSVSACRKTVATVCQLRFLLRQCDLSIGSKLGNVSVAPMICVLPAKIDDDVQGFRSVSDLVRL